MSRLPIPIPKSFTCRSARICLAQRRVSDIRWWSLFTSSGGKQFCGPAFPDVPGGGYSFDNFNVEIMWEGRCLRESFCAPLGLHC